MNDHKISFRDPAPRDEDLHPEASIFDDFMRRALGVITASDRLVRTTRIAITCMVASQLLQTVHAEWRFHEMDKRIFRTEKRIDSLEVFVKGDPG